jgi:hypothetical protein
LVWKKGDAELRIEVAEGTPADLLPGALGMAFPYAGCGRGVQIFADRVRWSAGTRAGAEAALLGYVMAHEIAHVLQGVDRHSDTGVMKAHWTPGDRDAILDGRLEFEEHDAYLMRRGLEAGVCRPLMSRSEGRSAAHPARP